MPALDDLLVAPVTMQDAHAAVEATQQQLGLRVFLLGGLARQFDTAGALAIGGGARGSGAFQGAAGRFAKA